MGPRSRRRWPTRTLVHRSPLKYTPHESRESTADALRKTPSRSNVPASPSRRALPTCCPQSGCDTLQTSCRWEMLRVALDRKRDVDRVRLCVNSSTGNPVVGRQAVNDLLPRLACASFLHDVPVLLYEKQCPDAECIAIRWWITVADPASGYVRIERVQTRDSSLPPCFAGITVVAGIRRGLRSR